MLFQILDFPVVRHCFHESYFSDIYTLFEFAARLLVQTMAMLNGWVNACSIGCPNGCPDECIHG